MPEYRLSVLRPAWSQFLKFHIWLWYLQLVANAYNKIQQTFCLIYFLAIFYHENLAVTRHSNQDKNHRQSLQ